MMDGGLEGMVGRKLRNFRKFQKFRISSKNTIIMMDYPEISKIYKLISKDLYLNGTSNSSTFSGLLSVIKELNLSKNSIFLDIGSGFGIPCIVVAKLYGCKCYGIEYDKNILNRSIYYAKLAGVSNLCTFVNLDIRNLNSKWIRSRYITHIYTFDKAIIPITWNHMHDVIESSSGSIKYLSSCFNLWKNTKLLSKKRVKLIGSAETKTIYIFVITDTM